MGEAVEWAVTDMDSWCVRWSPRRTGRDQYLYHLVH